MLTSTANKTNIRSSSFSSLFAIRKENIGYPILLEQQASILSLKYNYKANRMVIIFAKQRSIVCMLGVANNRNVQDILRGRRLHQKNK
jgi:hypothetical protein